MACLNTKLRRVNKRVEKIKAELKVLNKRLDNGERYLTKSCSADRENCIFSTVVVLNAELEQLRKERRNMWDSFYHPEERKLTW